MLSELEHILTSSYKEGMIAFLKTHPEYFDEAVRLAIEDRPLYSWRAAWLLWSCIENNDRRVRPHIKKIISSLENKNDGHQRELLKILLCMELSKDQEAYLFDKCLYIWEQINKRPSVRYTAFRFILKAAKRHPNLAREIDYLVSDQYMNSLSPGVRRSLLRMIEEAGVISG